MSIGFKIIDLGCAMSRRGIAIQLPPSILAQLIILKPIAWATFSKSIFGAFGDALNHLHQ
jgi:hypothetical protein